MDISESAAIKQINENMKNIIPAVKRENIIEVKDRLLSDAWINPSKSDFPILYPHMSQNLFSSSTSLPQFGQIIFIEKTSSFFVNVFFINIVIYLYFLSKF